MKWRASTDPVVRVLRRVRVDDNGCWVWSGRTEYGYGRVTVGRRSLGTRHSERVHRITFEHYWGQIPSGLQIDHVCRNRACVRPSHLRIVTCRDNVHANGSTCLQKKNAEKTHCIRGHEFNAANTMHRLYRGLPRRTCRICARASARASYARRTATP